MFLCCDDIGMEHKDKLSNLDELKVRIPQLKVNCFVIAKDIQDWFKEWYISRKEWVEIGVHGYDHDNPPECEREDRKERIEKALKILKPYLPKKYGFRAAGFQMTASTYPVLRDLSFWYIAHQTRVQLLKDMNGARLPILNCHIYDDLRNIPAEVDFEFFSTIV